MWIIEYENGVYASEWGGDPGRTVLLENAQKFSDKAKAKAKMDRIIERVKSFRKLPNARVRLFDEVKKEFQTK